jgi:hypothetical protein
MLPIRLLCRRLSAMSRMQDIRRETSSKSETIFVMKLLGGSEKGVDRNVRVLYENKFSSTQLLDIFCTDGGDELELELEGWVLLFTNLAVGTTTVALASGLYSLWLNVTANVD